MLIGGGGHARSVFDAIEAAGEYEIAGFVDADSDLEGYRTARLLGTDADLRRVKEGGVSYAHVSVGYLGKGSLRERLVALGESAGFLFPAIVDPSAAIATDAEVGNGSFIGKLSVVNSAARIDAHCIINSGAIVEHDVEIGAFSHIAPGAVVCGGACLGRRVFVAAGAVVGPGVRIGNGSVVAAGTVLLQNLDNSQLAIGCPPTIKEWSS